MPVPSELERGIKGKGRDDPESEQTGNPPLQFVAVCMSGP